MFREVGTNVFKALRGRVCRGSLMMGQMLAWAVGWGAITGRTLISASALSNVAIVRATMMMFAPFAANCLATLLPMPSDAPVRRTVL